MIVAEVASMLIVFVAPPATPITIGTRWAGLPIGTLINPRYDRLKGVMAHETVGARIRTDGIQRRSLSFALGDGAVDVNAVAANGGQRDPKTAAGSRAKSGLWIMDAGYSIDAGEFDRFRLSGAVHVSRFRPIYAVDDGHWRHDRMIGVSLGWQHGDRFNLSGGWSSTMSGQTN